MSYKITVYNIRGERIADLGTRPTITAARQAMLDHSNTVDLPSEPPWLGSEIGIVEGWWVGFTEYLIEAAGRPT